MFNFHVKATFKSKRMYEESKSNLSKNKASFADDVSRDVFRKLSNILAILC